MRNKLNVQKKMVFRHYWLKDIMPLSKKSILMAALLSLGLVATTDAYAVKGNQTYASGAMADVQSVMQTAKKLTGKVVDAKGESIIGATIKVKGTGQGAISDIDGNFSLPVDTAYPYNRNIFCWLSNKDSEGYGWNYCTDYIRRGYPVA